MTVATTEASTREDRPGDGLERSLRDQFKTYLRKIGSGEHTSSGLSRDEAREAMEMILRRQASDAQIGAFLIAHRIRRPEPQELTGMLDLYRDLGPNLTTAGRALCFGMPFDGRTRTAPIYPLTALVLAAVGIPVVLQGGDRMPVKYGITAMELFSSLGLSLQDLPISTVQRGLDSEQLALIHQPDHFPLADTLNGFREDLGKRPPVASLELMWTAHQGAHLMVSGFVHPPTETRTWKALHMAGEVDLVTVKGLEGSTDLPISRACITARVQSGRSERLILHPRDHDCYEADAPWSDLESWAGQALAALAGQGELSRALLWNCGVYLWLFGHRPSLEEGLQRSRQLLKEGAGLQKLSDLIAWRSRAS